MSCDLQFSHAGVMFKGATKVTTLSPKVARDMFDVDKAFIGFCGDADKWAEVVAWYDNPVDKPPNIKGMELLMLTSDKQIFHASSTVKSWLKIDEPFYAIGSGMHLALAAMATGKSPQEAVKIAAKYDKGTGLGVKTYKL
jgi:hypothetical protein